MSEGLIGIVESLLTKLRVQKSLSSLENKVDKLSDGYQREKNPHTEAILKDMEENRKDCRLYLTLRRQCEEGKLPSTLVLLGMTHTLQKSDHIPACPFSNSK